MTSSYSNRFDLRRASAVIAVVCLALGGCVASSEDDLRPNVLLITVDTLRADHLGAYGYGVDTSPNIDTLAAGGSLVERCVSTAPETAPGTASLLTGLYQDTHTVMYNRRWVPDDITTLAEHLSAAGYRTAGFTGNFLVGAKFGFGQGFDVFEMFEGVIPVAPRDAVGTKEAIDWLSKQDSGEARRPWFLWVHYMDPHGPYAPADTTWSDAIRYDEGAFGDDPELEVTESNFGLGIIPRYQKVRKYTRLSQYVRRYDGEIRATDAQIGELLAAVEKTDAADSTLVVLSADHGESLTEHREYLQHGWFLYDTTLRIPLIFRLPGTIAAGTRVQTQAEAVDLLPSILDLAGIAPSTSRIDGRSLADTLRGGAEPDSKAAFAYGPRDNRQFAVSKDGYKLIHTPAGAPLFQGGPRQEGAPERFELYATRDDPGETRELGRDHPRFTELHRALMSYEKTFSQRLWERLRKVQSEREESLLSTEE